MLPGRAWGSILATYVEPQFRELHFMQPLNKPALTIFLFFITACSKQVPYEQLVRRHDIYYEVNSTTPFSGTYVAHHQNGQLEREFSLKQGIPHGPYAIYYDNGQWQQKVNFKHGAEDGEEVRYYKNGQLWMESRYKEGTQVGRATSYYETGQLKYEFNYEKDRFHGPHTQYHSNGQLSLKGAYKNGKKDGAFVCFTADGQARKCQIWEFIPEDIWG